MMMMMMMMMVVGASKIAAGHARRSPNGFS